MERQCKGRYARISYFKDKDHHPGGNIDHRIDTMITSTNGCYIAFLGTVHYQRNIRKDVISKLSFLDVLSLRSGNSLTPNIIIMKP